MEWCKSKGGEHINLAGYCYFVGLSYTNKYKVNCHNLRVLVLNRIVSTMVLLGLLLVSQPASALTKKQVLAWTETVALVSGAIAYYIACPGSCALIMKKIKKELSALFTITVMVACVVLNLTSESLFA